MSLRATESSPESADTNLYSHSISWKSDLIIKIYTFV